MYRPTYALHGLPAPELVGKSCVHTVANCNQPERRLHSLVRGSVRGSLCGESPLGTPLGAPIGKPRGTPLDRPSGPPTSALPGTGTGTGRVTGGYSTPSPAILPLTLFYPYPYSTLTWPSSLRGFGR